MTPLTPLLAAAAERFAAHPSPIADELAGALREVAGRPIAIAPAEVPLCRRLPALDAVDAEPLLGQVLARAASLHWRTRGAGRPPPLAAGLASVELVGPTGMIPFDGLRFGVFLQERHLDYTWHRHAAEELYLVLHGEATWASDTAEPRRVPPGEFVHHASWQPHRMVTGEAVMLALWGWCGDVDFERYELLEGPSAAGR